MLPPVRVIVVARAAAVSAPPLQFVAAFGTAAMATFKGSVSTNGFVRERAAALEFPRLIVRIDVLPGLIVPGLKLFATVGGTGACTTRPAVAGTAGLPPPTVVRSVVWIVFVYEPATADVTETVIVQPPDGIVEPLAHVTVPDPAPAVTTPAHVPPTFGTGATTTFAGRLSLKAEARVSAPAFGFPNVIVSVDVPLTGIVARLKLFAIVGGAGTLTPRLAVAGCWLTPWPVESWPAAIVFVYVPASEDVTSTVIWQPPDWIVAPFAYEMVDEPATAVTSPMTPGHVFVMFGVAATKTFPGSVSVNKAFSVWMAAFVLPNVIVRVDVPPEAIEAGLKALATVGGAAIVRVAWAAPRLLSPSLSTTLPIGMLLM